MNIKIGFTAEKENSERHPPELDYAPNDASPRKSVVQVYFQSRGLSCSYYNDSFDLHCGDTVYVNGKLEGLRGKVTDVSYNFKIKLSDYKRVIGKADTRLTGKLYFAGSHAISFEPSALPFDKVRSWFAAPENPDEEFATGSDDSSFSLENLGSMNFEPQVSSRGVDYYSDNRVVYISLDGKIGRAVVDGSKPYEVNFSYNNGEISNLTCNCFCSYPCKHEFAAMLQLRETLKNIEENYSQLYAQSNYFAAVSLNALFSFAVENKTKGCIDFGN